MKTRVVTQEERDQRRVIALANGTMPPHFNGVDHYNWKGGITSAYERERHSAESRAWCKAIKIRDDYTCQICGERGGNLQSNHIKKWSDYPALRFEMANGITLCVDCHKKVTRHEEEWESYFNFNLMVRGYIADANMEPVNELLLKIRRQYW